MAQTERGDREARRDALRHAHQVGFDAERLDGEHLAGAAEAALHLVDDEQDAVVDAPLGDAFDEGLGCRDVAALADHRLDDDGRHLVGQRSA